MKKITISEKLFFMAVFTKQFYLFSSGSIGIADLLFIVSVGIVAYKNWKHRKGFFNREDTLWGVFLTFVILINGFYFIQTGNKEFLWHTMYWIYSACLIWGFRTLYSEPFMINLCWICRINVVCQVIVLISGQGRYFYESWGGSRFMGTFNDPNQFAFFIFTMILVLFMEYRRRAVYTIKARVMFWGIFSAGVFLIGSAKSTGIFFGLLFFWMVLGWQFFQERYSSFHRNICWWIGGIIFVIALLIGLYAIWPDAMFDVSQTDYTIVSRVQQKLWKLANGNFYDVLYDRSAERLVLQPQYLLYGAGEGFFERFVPYKGFEQLLSPGVFDVFHVNEIHSSFFDVWFSYGIIPTVLLASWIVRNVVRCDRAQRAAVIALLAESFTLMNCRQPFFWFIIVMAGMHEKDE